MEDLTKEILIQYSGQWVNGLRNDEKLLMQKQCEQHPELHPHILKAIKLFARENDSEWRPRVGTIIKRAKEIKYGKTRKPQYTACSKCEPRNKGWITTQTGLQPCPNCRYDTWQKWAAGEYR